MHELGKDPARIRILAERLLKTHTADWTDWELDFLEGMSVYSGPDALTTRQSEKLVELRDATVFHSSVDGFNVKALIDSCWLARHDLESDGDLEFIERLKAEARTALRRGELLRLLHCARELGVIERYVLVDA